MDVFAAHGRALDKEMLQAARGILYAERVPTDWVPPRYFRLSPGSQQVPGGDKRQCKLGRVLRSGRRIVRSGALDDGRL